MSSSAGCWGGVCFCTELCVRYLRILHSTWLEACTKTLAPMQTIGNPHTGSYFLPGPDHREADRILPGSEAVEYQGGSAQKHLHKFRSKYLPQWYLWNLTCFI